MKKITQLTKEQQDKFPEYVKCWTEKGLSTSNPPREESESAIRLAYKCAGIKEPSIFIWVDSPLHAGVCYALLKSEKVKEVFNSVRDSVSASVSASVWESVRDSMGDSVWESVQASVRESVQTSVRDSVSASVRVSVWDSVWWDSVAASEWDSVGASVRVSVWDSVRVMLQESVGASVPESLWDSVWSFMQNSVSASVWVSCYGSHDAAWLAFFSYIHKELQIDCSRLNGLWECCEKCGWFIPFENIVIVSPKPYQIKTRINERGIHELHADGEPAVAYCEDFKIYAYHGVRLPEKYGSIPSSKWNPQWFVEEKNVEIKRVIAEALGYEKLFSALNAIKIDSYREYDLYRAENVDIEPVHILKMVCPSTGHIHYGRVSPNIMSAREAATLRNGGYDPESFIVEH